MKSVKQEEAAAKAAVAKEARRRRRRYRNDKLWLLQRALQAQACQTRKMKVAKELRDMGTRATEAIATLQGFCRGCAARAMLWRNEQKRKEARKYLLHRVLLVHILRRKQTAALEWLKEQGKQARVTVHVWSVQLLAQHVQRVLDMELKAAVRVQVFARSWVIGRRQARLRLTFHSVALQEVAEELAKTEAQKHLLDAENKRERAIADVIEAKLKAHPKLQSNKQVKKYVTKVLGLEYGKVDQSDRRSSSLARASEAALKAAAIRAVAFAVIDAAWDVSEKKPAAEVKAAACLAARATVPRRESLQRETAAVDKKKTELTAKSKRLRLAVQQGGKSKQCGQTQRPLTRLECGVCIPIPRGRSRKSREGEATQIEEGGDGPKTPLRGRGKNIEREAGRSRSRSKSPKSKKRRKRRLCERMLEEFKEMDTDDNGFITAEEQLTFWQKRYPDLNVNNVEVEEQMSSQFEKLDVDNDGKISLAEFMAGLQLSDVWSEIEEEKHRERSPKKTQQKAVL